MKSKPVRNTALAMSFAVLLAGCATSPQDCQLNQTATGALIGAGVGGALGGLGAAIGGANGGTGLAIAAGGALAGALIGAAIGQHNDEVCHQMALQQALDNAMAANVAWHEREARREEVEQRIAEERARQHKYVGHHAVQKALPLPPSRPEYETVTWADKMTNTTGAITPLSNTTVAANSQVCMSFDDRQTVNGQTKIVPARACRGPDGKWTQVN